MERNNVITTLEVLRTNCSKHSRDYQALDYAISSLKTDEAYQIIYEGGEMFTKADMVAMLEDLKQDFIAEAYGIEMDCTNYVVNVADIDKVIQQKIDALKADKSEK